MTEKTVKLYSIDELSEEVKKKVLEKLWDINIDFGWWTLSYEQFVEDAAAFGFEIKTSFSGRGKQIFFRLHEQGSGLCFEYDMEFEAILEHYVDKTGWSEVKLNFVKKYAEFRLEGVHRGNYYHENSVYHRSIDSYYCDKPLFDTRLCLWQAEIGMKVEDKYKELCRKYYRQLDDEYDALTSEEAIIETIKVNEWLFTENGTQLCLE